MDIHKDRVDRRGRTLVPVSLQKRAEIRRNYFANISWWRRPRLGYLISIPLVGLTLLAVLEGRRLLPNFYFPAMSMAIPILIVALIWGVGPALFTVVLATLALDYFYVSPVEQSSVITWHGFLQLLPFVIFGMIISIFTGQREAARMRALLAEQEAQAQADELAELNQQLEEANKLKDQFLSMASHELKTPITAILGQAQITLRRLSRQQERALDTESISTALEKIDEQARRLNMLVDDLLDLSSIRGGKIALRMRRCDLGEVCRKVVEDQRLLTDRPIDLEVSPPSIELQADSDRLGQVIVNLVNNAIKYSPEGSPVRVVVSRTDAVALLQVIDAGPGIPREQQQRIFETFYRAPNAKASSSDGFGLGLAICKDIVERHDGRIWCESQEGEGSTFCVELPLK